MQDMGFPECSSGPWASQHRFNPFHAVPGPPPGSPKNPLYLRLPDPGRDYVQLHMKAQKGHYLLLVPQPGHRSPQPGRSIFQNLVESRRLEIILSDPLEKI